MNNSGTIHTVRSRRMNDECRRIRRNLPDELLKELDGQASSGLFEHIRCCRGCLEAYIALLAAAELATPGDDHHAR